MLGEVPAIARANHWAWVARVAMTIGDFPRSIELSRRALAEENALGRRSQAAAIEARVAMLHHYVGDDSAADAGIAALPDAAALEPYHATVVLFVRGMLLQRRDRNEEARPFFAQALAISKAAGLREQEAKAIGQLAWLDFSAGRFPDARTGFDAAAKMLGEMGERRMSIAYAGDVGLVLLEEGATDAARERLRGAIEAHRQLVDRWLEAEFHGHLGCLELVAGRPDVAKPSLEEAIRLHGVTRDEKRIAFFEAVRAACVAELGGIEEAERALAEIRALDRTGPVMRACAAHVELAKRTGEARREEARALAASLVATSVPEQRIVGRALESALARLRASPVAEIVVARDGAWLKSGDIESSFDGAAARRLVAWLAQRRVSAPGVSLDVDALFAAGWPDERASAETRRNRVRVALTRLRRAGLRDLLVARKDGYHLDPAIALGFA
jgi:tetratricopeptide (TPR) repeat protein